MLLQGCLLTVPGDVQLDQLHEVCHLGRESLNLIVAEAQLPQVQQAKERLKGEEEDKMSVGKPYQTLSSSTATINLNHSERKMTQDNNEDQACRALCSTSTHSTRVVGENTSERTRDE